MKKVSFCGISGSGMSALAQILCHMGVKVRGSDRNFDLQRDLKTKKALESLGIQIYPQDGSAIDESLDFVCASTAVEDTIADIKAAKNKNITIITRPQLLAQIFHSYKYGVAVGGTSGKTTVTAMIGYILDKSGKKPCMINGGLLRNYENAEGIPNIIYNKGKICVVEADESNGSIDLYNPYISVVTNISKDHKTLSELSELFQNLATRTSYGMVINADYELCKKISYGGKKVYFSLSDKTADFYASDIQPLPDGTQYVLNNKKYRLSMIGKHNVANALAAIAVCEMLGVDRQLAAETLETFYGTKRRMEIIGSKKSVTVIDDFAHNPDKVAATVQALRQYNGRLIVVFQPHGFEPMRQMGREIMDTFKKYLSSQDILLMPEIFFVGGTVNKDISSEDLIEYVQEQGLKNAHFVNDKKQAKDFILQNVQPNDRIVVMGARDSALTDLCQQILEEI